MDSDLRQNISLLMVIKKLALLLSWNMLKMGNFLIILKNAKDFHKLL